METFTLEGKIREERGKERRTAHAIDGHGAGGSLRRAQGFDFSRGEREASGANSPVRNGPQHDLHRCGERRQ